MLPTVWVGKMEKQNIISAIKCEGAEKPEAAPGGGPKQHHSPTLNLHTNAIGTKPALFVGNTLQFLMPFDELCNYVSAGVGIMIS